MSSLVSGSAFGFSGPDWIGSNIMKDRNREDAQIAFDRSAEFQERMANTSWQRGVADMQAAGINPMLAINQGGASSPTPQMPLPHSSLVSGGANVSTNYQTSAQVALLNAQVDRTYAEADEVRARTPTHAVTIEQMKQNIAESIERINSIRADILQKHSTAARNYQQIENLRAELPKIKADTNRLVQQARNLAASTDLQTAEEKAIQQRLRQDLPELERQQRALEAIITKMSLPGHMVDEAAKDSFIGQLGAYLKALLPLQGIMGALPVGRSRTIIHNAPPVNIKVPRSFTP